MLRGILVRYTRNSATQANFYCLSVSLIILLKKKQSNFQVFPVVYSKCKNVNSCVLDKNCYRFNFKYKLIHSFLILTFHLTCLPRINRESCDFLMIKWRSCDLLAINFRSCGLILQAS